MLDSYFEEVHKRRLIARIFWTVVLIFAVLLFFFFKGYYFAFNVWMETIWKSGWEEYGKNTHESEPIIKQFWVVHIITKPSDTGIVFDTEDLRSGERKIVDYGKHTLSYQKNGYIGGSRNITIDHDIPYYMDKISLVSLPKYEQTTLRASHTLYQISDTHWLSLSWSQAMLFWESFDSKKNISIQKTWYPVGDRYLTNGKSIIAYNDFLEAFSIQNNPKVQNFLRKCSQPHYQYGFFSCKNHNTLISQDAKMFTGVLERGRNFIKQKNTLILYENTDNLAQHFVLSGSLVQAKTFVHIDEDWYVGSGSSLFPMSNSSWLDPISFDVEALFFSQKIQDFFVFLWKKWDKTVAIVFDPKHESLPNTVELPDLNWKDIKIVESQWTIFIKTRDALLFFYKKDSVVHWIVDGEIRAFGKNFVIYVPKDSNKNSALWKATWKIGS